MTIMNDIEGFQYVRGNYLLLPYVPKLIDFKQDILVDMYNRLKEEDLHQVIFHDDPGQTLNQFIAFFSSPLVALTFMVYVDNGVEKPVGMSWVTDIFNSGTAIKKATASYVFFKEYQSPVYTSRFRDMSIDFWFNRLNIDLITGMTPATNRAALVFNKRAGFKEAGRIPNYTLLYGQKCDGVLTYLEKDTFNSRMEK